MRKYTYARLKEVGLELHPDINKRLRNRQCRAIAWLERVKRKQPAWFVHWCDRGELDVGAMGAESTGRFTLVSASS